MEWELRNYIFRILYAISVDFVEQNTDLRLEPLLNYCSDNFSELTKYEIIKDDKTVNEKNTIGAILVCLQLSRKAEQVHNN